MKKIKYFILPFLAILGVVNVKAYDFNGINKTSRVDFGLYQDTTQLYQVSCTSSNDGYCGLEDSDLPNVSNTYNNIRFVLRGNLNKTFTVGTQYKISWYFYQVTPGYFIRSADITQVTGNTYRDFTNWTTDSLTILTYNLSLIETESTKGLYRMDITFIPSTTNIAGFNFRLYSDSQTISNNNDCYLEGTRYLQIVQLSADSPDYTQDLNNINQNISNMGDDIVNNQNQNTQDIINNQNQNTQDIIDSNRVCQSSTYDSTSGFIRGYLLENGSVSSNPSSSYTTTDYISISSVSVIKLVRSASQNLLYCFYDSSKASLSCNYVGSLSAGSTISVPSNASFVRFTIRLSDNLPVYEITTCKNGSQAISDSLTDDDVSGANSSASNFFSSFQTDTYGLSSIMTAPLNFIKSLTSQTCSSLVLPLPFVNSNLSLPCMTEIYQSKFGSILTLYQTITFGIVSYWVIVRVFNLVKDFKNPDHDEVEVMDL